MATETTFNCEMNVFVFKCIINLSCRSVTFPCKRLLKWVIGTGTQDEDKQSKNTTQYVVDTTIGKQTQIT
jgi:hypothetical protein